MPATCGARGVVVLEYPSNGIQNGDPDGFALVNGAGEVIEFLSYGGTFTAANGPAAGMTSVDIGVKQSATTPIGESLQRDGSGAWSGPKPGSLGSCNDAEETPPGPVASLVVTPATSTIAAGTAQQFTATAFGADGQPLAGVPFTWSSSDDAIASVTSAGLATGSATGTVQITAAAPNGISGSASLEVVANPPPPGTGSVWISEIHYDNVGTDVGESIEVEAPAGADLSGWRLILYNGNGGAAYGTTTLAGIVPASCGARGVMVIIYPSNGIQNGDPEGVALVDAGGQVVEFISYGGTFVAVGGPANGMLSVDIGVKQSTSTPLGLSLQRSAGGVWTGPVASTFGACNDGDGTIPPERVVGDIVIHELMSDPVNADGATWGEWFEVHNRSASSIDLQGWTIASGGQPVHQIASSVVVPAGGYAVLGRGGDINRNGGVELDYNYFSGSATTIWLDDSDWLVLRSTSGATVDSVRWSGLARGVTRAVRDAGMDNTDANGANWGYSTVQFGAGDFGTPGASNGTLSNSPPSVRGISFSGRAASEPPLPVGFEDQLFATLRDENGQVVTSTFTWLSETPTIASVDVFGVVRARAAGTAVIRASAADGTVGRFQMPTIDATASTSASYVGNAEFGEPADGDPSDDFIIRYPQFTASFNGQLNIPNEDVEVIGVIMPNVAGIRNVDWRTYLTTVDAVEALSGYDLLALLPDPIEIAVESGTRPPDAVANGPYSQIQGSPVSLSAAGSSDPDGQPLTFQWNFGDGATASGAVVTHTCGAIRPARSRCRAADLPAYREEPPGRLTPPPAPESGPRPRYAACRPLRDGRCTAAGAAGDPRDGS